MAFLAHFALLIRTVIALVERRPAPPATVLCIAAPQTDVCSYAWAQPARNHRAFSGQATDRTKMKPAPETESFWCWHLAPAMHATFQGKVDREHPQHSARKYSKPKAEPTHLSARGNHRAWQEGGWGAFSERTKTEVVSAHGALILLQEPVCAGQELTLRNIATSEEIACAVVECNQGHLGVPEVGLQFNHPSPRFWRVAFPRPIGVRTVRKQRDLHPQRKSTQTRQIRSRIPGAAPVRLSANRRGSLYPICTGSHLQ
jgi:hypothetical protein